MEEVELHLANTLCIVRNLYSYLLFNIFENAMFVNNKNVLDASNYRSRTTKPWGQLILDKYLHNMDAHNIIHLFEKKAMCLKKKNNKINLLTGGLYGNAGAMRSAPDREYHFIEIIMQHMSN